MAEALTKITAVVDNYLMLKGNYSKENYLRYLHIILNGRREYGTQSSTELKTVELTIDSKNIIKVPIDFYDYVRIGYAVGDEIWTLTENRNIRLPQGITCGVEESADATPIDSTVWMHFGNPGGNNFLYYRYDKQKRRIVFQGDGVGRTVIIEYLSDGVELDGQTYVPSDMIPMLTAYLEWQLKLYGVQENKTNNDTEYYGREFRACKQQYMASQFAFTADEVLDTIRGQYKQTMKR